MKKKEMARKKASLSWTREDYQIMNDEEPECLTLGKTEGEALDEEGVAEWIREEVQCLSVFKEDYPDKFNEQYNHFLLDLEYLRSLGKIKDNDYQMLTADERIFDFGQKKSR